MSASFRSYPFNYETLSLTSKARELYQGSLNFCRCSSHISPPYTMWLCRVQLGYLVGEIVNSFLCVLQLWLNRLGFWRCHKLDLMSAHANKRKLQMISYLKNISAHQHGIIRNTAQLIYLANQLYFSKHANSGKNLTHNNHCM